MNGINKYFFFCIAKNSIFFFHLNEYFIWVIGEKLFLLVLYSGYIAYFICKFAGCYVINWQNQNLSAEKIFPQNFFFPTFSFFFFSDLQLPFWYLFYKIKTEQKVWVFCCCYIFNSLDSVLDRPNTKWVT